MGGTVWPSLGQPGEQYAPMGTNLLTIPVMISANIVQKKNTPTTPTIMGAFTHSLGPMKLCDEMIAENTYIELQ